MSTFNDLVKDKKSKKKNVKITALQESAAENEGMPPFIEPAAVQDIRELYRDHPEIQNKYFPNDPIRKIPYTYGSEEHNEGAWIQTYSGKRFTPTNPNSESIVIQDIAHALSMQCRFTGHVRQFYSVAQHSVLVSYFCNHEDALWGLLHDATEAYLQDFASPLKRSGLFNSYIDFEKKMQTAVCARFNLEDKEPPSVKRADQLLLVTEARDLMGSLRQDWTMDLKPLPIKINPLAPAEAKILFLQRFFELIGFKISDPDIFQL